MPEIDVLDSTMYYEELGEGPPVVFLHGNPTSSYLWRNVLPPVARQARCLAPDLIGMGRSGKPDIGYRFTDHAAYLDAWFDALALDQVTLVGHDWGGALGFHWARRNPDRVVGIAFMETIVKEFTWDEWPEQAREIFQGFRTPGMGEDLCLERNLFVEAVLPASVVRTLTDEEMAAYRAPYPDPASRKPTLAWPREIPIEGEPADVCEIVAASGQYLAATEVPRLLLTFEPGAIMSEPVIAWCQRRIEGLAIRQLGAGIHFVQEDQPEAIAEAVAAWHRREILA